ncbi:hypothetical protein [Catenuloplanes japonicus]|uniref:hypothetical protein n=1 Tax=Catenuloplanes japonicus TaxID=33876 RepID=UPI00052459A6|nr:hypothetical protein [Catenuloplanes japonicus]
MSQLDLSDPGVRHRLLAEGPVGAWETFPGTHTALMYDLVRFGPDGTGEIRSESVLGGESFANFTWSVRRSGLLACIVTEASYLPETDDDTEPDEVETVGFEFAQRHSDLGTFWVMRDPRTDGFWNLGFPLSPRTSR